MLVLVGEGIISESGEVCTSMPINAEVELVSSS